MDTLLGGFLFAVFVLAQVAAVIAVHGERQRRQPQAFDAALDDPRVRLIRHSAG